jgi:hypothetical protein
LIVQSRHAASLSGGTVVLAIALVIAACALVALVASVLRGQQGESDGGGDQGPPGGGRPRPTPSPGPVDGLIDWPEFERQFASYAARHTRRRSPRAPAAS